MRFYHATGEVKSMKMLLRIAEQTFNLNCTLYASSGLLGDYIKVNADFGILINYLENSIFHMIGS